MKLALRPRAGRSWAAEGDRRAPRIDRRRAGAACARRRAAVAAPAHNVRAPTTIGTPACSGGSSASSITTSPKARRSRRISPASRGSSTRPAAEQNLSRRVKTATAIQVEDPIVLPIDDPRLFQYPWIYFVEPGTLKLLDADVAILREYFLRGGTAMFDDFHGPIEWDNFEHEMKRVFPNRPIVEVPKDHPVFSAVYKIDGFPQVAGIGSFMQGRTWEKGGFVPHLRTILDDSGRPMMFINWNTDMGDGWEWSNVVEFPQYIKFTSMAYQMAINEIVYSLTH